MRILKKNIRRLALWEKVLIVAVLFMVVDDLTHRYAVHTFENTAQFKEYTKIKGYVDAKEDNASITSISVSTFLTEVKPENSIYFAATTKWYRDCHYRQREDLRRQSPSFCCYYFRC